MITIFQAVILGAIQGLTELFPVSSLGHSVIVPKVLGWGIDQGAPLFLNFVIATHLATMLVLLAFFWQDWVLIIKGLFRSLKARKIPEGDTHAKMAWLIIIATIPAGLLGALLQKKIGEALGSAVIAAIALTLNGVLLWGAEQLAKRTENLPAEGDDRIARLSFGQGLKVGIFQLLALIPGFSRTGAALSGGLLSNLPREDAARFSFLLAAPLIAGAALLKLPKFIASAHGSALLPLAVGFVASGIASYFSVTFLSKYFKTKSLMPFAAYCVIVGVISFLVLR